MQLKRLTITETDQSGDEWLCEGTTKLPAGKMIGQLSTPLPQRRGLRIKASSMHRLYLIFMASQSDVVRLVSSD